MIANRLIERSDDEKHLKQLIRSDYPCAERRRLQTGIEYIFDDRSFIYIDKSGAYWAGENIEIGEIEE